MIKRVYRSLSQFKSDPSDTSAFQNYERQKIMTQELEFQLYNMKSRHYLVSRTKE